MSSVQGMKRNSSVRVRLRAARLITFAVVSLLPLYEKNKKKQECPIARCWEYAGGIANTSADGRRSKRRLRRGQQQQQQPPRYDIEERAGSGQGTHDQRDSGYARHLTSPFPTGKGGW